VGKVQESNSADIESIFIRHVLLQVELLEVDAANGGGIRSLISGQEDLGLTNDIRHYATHPPGVCASLPGL
jgi:hypothetical protein